MSKTVFITGASGFIGSNLAKRILATEPDTKVIGLDNMNDYYDVRIKEARLAELQKFENYTFIKGNLADKALINSIFEQYHPNIVVNLGAQAGVRYSMSALQLSRPSVTSYLPYEKGVYFPEDADAENISTGAERQRHYRAVTALKKNPCEENLWKCVVAFRGYKFKTLSGLPFTYKLKKGRGDEFTKELWIDRRESSKSLAWSSVMRAYQNIGKVGEVVDRPKALGDIRGVSYIYGVFYRFGLIDVPKKVKEKMTK